MTTKHTPHNKKAQSSYGFTIVELLIVIVVIAVLAAISIVAYNGIQRRAIETALKSDLKNAATQLGVMYATDGTYPSPTASLQKSPDTNLQYTSADGTSYCITAASSKLTNTSFYMTDTTSMAAGACSGHSTGGPVALTCPSGFIVVPGNPTFGTTDFCVMKYEAKNVGGVATSQAAGLPWVNISQVSATTTAQAACSGCHLISEAEWMTIAANVLSVPSNWSGNAVGSGYIYSGHNDNAPGGLLAASTSDTDGYSGTGNTAPSNQRRTLTLTNGEVIWDLAANTWEWTSGTMTGNQPGSATYQWRQYTAITNWGSLPATSRPAAAGAGSWGSAQGIGMLISDSADSRAVGYIRGGLSSDGNYAGVLALNLYNLTTGTHPQIGFRVAK